MDLEIFGSSFVPNLDHQPHNERRSLKRKISAMLANGKSSYQRTSWECTRTVRIIAGNGGSKKREPGLSRGWVKTRKKGLIAIVIKDLLGNHSFVGGSMQSGYRSLACSHLLRGCALPRSVQLSSQVGSTCRGCSSVDEGTARLVCSSTS